jgi:putative hydrolase of the HAD superfamily
VDVFVSSCFVGLRKPDVNIFRIALDVGMFEPAQVVYLENTQMFVDVAEGLGIRSILHKDYQDTATQLTALGFPIE